MTLLRSWIETANDPDCPFPMNNLPFGVFSYAGSDPRCCTAIGNKVLDLGGMQKAGLLKPLGLNEPALNSFMELGPDAWAGLRATLFGFLGEGSETMAMVQPHLYPMDAVKMHLPFPRFRIHRFLRRPAPRHKRGHNVPRPGERPAAELAAYPDRL